MLFTGKGVFWGGNCISRLKEKNGASLPGSPLTYKTAAQRAHGCQVAGSEQPAQGTGCTAHTHRLLSPQSSQHWAVQHPALCCNLQDSSCWEAAGPPTREDSPQQPPAAPSSIPCSGAAGTHDTDCTAWGFAPSQLQPHLMRKILGGFFFIFAGMTGKNNDFIL